MKIGKNITNCCNWPNVFTTKAKVRYLKNQTAYIDLQGQDKLLVGCIYHSPSGAMETSISSLRRLLEELNDFTHLLILICGDFNMKDINWSTMSVNPRNTHADYFIDTIQDLFYFSTYKNQLISDQVLLPVCLTSYLQMKII